MKKRLLLLLILTVCLVSAGLPTGAAMQDDDSNILGVVVVTE